MLQSELPHDAKYGMEEGGPQPGLDVLELRVRLVSAWAVCEAEGRQGGQDRAQACS